MIGDKLCGTSPAGTTMQSTGNIMTLHFHTDYAVARSGFQIYAYAGKNHDLIPNCLAEVGQIFTSTLPSAYRNCFIFYKRLQRFTECQKMRNTKEKGKL